MNAQNQFSLDFSGKRPPEVQAKIADGMGRADANADPQWRHFCDACVLAAARKKQELTSDDVLAEMESLSLRPHTHTLAALGPVMKRGYEMGILEPTEKVVRSERPEKKGNYHKVWRSKVYAG